jgi:hypothetical protein
MVKRTESRPRMLDFVGACGWTYVLLFRVNSCPFAVKVSLSAFCIFCALLRLFRVPFLELLQLLELLELPLVVPICYLLFAICYSRV